MVSAAQIQFRQEMIAVFEQRETLLRDAVTTEVVTKGNQATFLVHGSGGDPAVTRGVDGLIPASNNQNDQRPIILEEWHKLIRKSGFDIFASQGNQREAMQMDACVAVNQKIDDQIFDALGQATVTLSGGAAPATTRTVLRAKTILQNAQVPWDENIFAIVTPAFEAYLLEDESYASADYVDMKVMPDGGNAYTGRPKWKRWLGVNWCSHPRVPGAGSNSSSNFMFHKSALGHACRPEGVDTKIGYDDEQDYSFARCTDYMNSALLQNSGIVIMPHDDTGMSS